MNKRRNYNSSFKSKVVLNCLKGEMTISELCSLYKLSSTCIHKWKKKAMDNFHLLFEDNGRSVSKPIISESEIDNLYAEIGKLKIERDFLSKKLKG